jgi:RNA polymerase sigma-70 factor (ECF subfamily)
MRESANPRRQRFEAEVLPHLDALHRSALRLTRNGSDADDLVQDAVIKAWRFFDGYEPGTNVRAWLLKILTNLFFTRYRRQGLEDNMHALGATDPVADGWVSAASMSAHREPERMAQRHLLEGAVAKVLDELPEDFRVVLVLADIEGLTYREVADAMGCPMGTVMSRLHRARRAVASRLGVVPSGEVSSEPAAPRGTVESVTSLDAYKLRKGRERTG